MENIENLLIRNDETFMNLAIKEAQKAYERGEVPIGVIIVNNGEVIARAYNQVELLKDATAHAEILAITQASIYLSDWRLNEAILYVTKEPCAMCAGAMVNCKLATVVYGASDPRSGAAGSAMDVTGFKGNLHRVNVKSGVLKDKCLDLLQVFFRERRKKAIN